jgi:hypothetical protein
MWNIGGGYMPQVSLYLDESTHTELEARAKLNRTSLSKFVVDMIKAQLSKGWPDGFQNLFGSIEDASFHRQGEHGRALDAPRESL